MKPMPLRLTITTALLVLLAASAARANEAAAPAEDHGAPPKADAHGGGKGGDHQAPGDDHGGDKKKGKAKGGGDHSAAPSLPERSDKYVHHWLAFPTIEGRKIRTGEPYRYKPIPGRAVVLVFVASWCLPCQQLVKPLKELQARYTPRYTDFIYVFAHDTEPDARGFATQYELMDHAIIGSAALLETFHQPELPTIYIGDRYNWMIMRKLNAQPSDLAAIGSYLDIHTSF